MRVTKGKKFLLSLAAEDTFECYKYSSPSPNKCRRPWCTILIPGMFHFVTMVKTFTYGFRGT